MNKYLLIVVAVAALSGCVNKEIKDKAASASDSTATNNLTQPIDTFTDSRDGKTYKTVKIGTAVWMAENLNYAEEGICYEKKDANCAKYGRMYGWYAAKKVCPAGYHLPSDDEWTALVDYAGGGETAGTKLKSATGWDKKCNGTNDFDFSALPGGDAGGVGYFGYAGSLGLWWSATEIDFYNASNRYMNCYKIVGWDNDDKSSLYSVRCVKD